MNNMRKTRIAYKFRIYPNKAQQSFIDQCIGFSRFIYNMSLAAQKDLTDKQKQSGEKLKRLSTGELYKLYAEKKKEEGFEWMELLPATVANSAIRNLDKAYATFFRELKKGKVAYPQFKKKQSAGSFGFQQGKVNVDAGNFTMPKLSPIRCVYHRPIQGVFDSKPVYVISRTAGGKYYVAFNTEIEVPDLKESFVDPVGIDIGAKDIAALSDGTIYGKVDNIASMQKRLHKMQSRLDRRKQNGSNNYKKERAKINRLFERITNKKNYELHAISNEIATNFDLVVIEDISLKDMTRKAKPKKNKAGKYVRNYKAQKSGLTKSLLSNSLGELRRQIEYKVDRTGGKVLKIDKWHPSSQLCSSCGHKNTEVKKLSLREWECPSCGTYHDRDINAAHNILKEGLKMIEA